MAAARTIDDVRKAWKEANLAPLWENPKAHRPAPPPDAAYLWSWDKIRPLIAAAIEVASPDAVERRVLQLVPPIAQHRDEQQTSHTLAANIQILLPGETARPHRHTMNALRFVLEGSGAVTVVDGKPCPMEEGDLVLTPAWTWHEHVHQGRVPIIWLDALDVPLQHYLGTGVFQPGPVAELPETVADAGPPVRSETARNPTGLRKRVEHMIELVSGARRLGGEAAPVVGVDGGMQRHPPCDIDASARERVKLARVVDDHPTVPIAPANSRAESRQVGSCPAAARAFMASRCRSTRSLIRRRSACASAATSFGGTSRPVPAGIVSGIAPAMVDTTGSPCATASASAIP